MEHFIDYANQIKSFGLEPTGYSLINGVYYFLFSRQEEVNLANENIKIKGLVFMTTSDFNKKYGQDITNSL